MKPLTNITTYILLLVVAVLTIGCSKKDQPTAPDGTFLLTLTEQSSLGHYTYNASLIIGNGVGNVTLEILPNAGAKGDLMVDGNKYIAPITITTSQELTIEYLPFSAGDHIIEIKATVSGKSQTVNFSIKGVTPLIKNYMFLPYKAWLDPKLGIKKLISADASVVSIKEVTTTETFYFLEWKKIGKTWVYATADNGVRTGCLLEACGDAELTGVEFDLTYPDGTVKHCSSNGAYEILEGTYGLTFTRLIPEKATIYNPRIYGGFFMDMQNVKQSRVFMPGDEIIGVWMENYTPIATNKAFTIIQRSVVFDTTTEGTQVNGTSVYLKAGQKIQLKTITTPLNDKVKWDYTNNEQKTEGALKISENGIIEWIKKPSRAENWIMGKTDDPGLNRNRHNTVKLSVYYRD